MPENIELIFPEPETAAEKRAMTINLCALIDRCGDPAFAARILATIAGIDVGRPAPPTPPVLPAPQPTNPNPVWPPRDRVWPRRDYPWHNPIWCGTTAGPAMPEQVTVTCEDARDGVDNCPYVW